MQSVLNNEMEIFWSEYRKLIKKEGVKNILEKSVPTLRKNLSIEYKSLFQDAKKKASRQGKTRSQTSYSVLKLRRLIALWSDKGVVGGNYVITYKNDPYSKFPLFSSQNFTVAPTVKTVQKIKATLLSNIVEKHNREVRRATKLGQPAGKQITNLSELRMFLIFKLGINPKAVPELLALYKDQSVKTDKGFSDGLKLL